MIGPAFGFGTPSSYLANPFTQGTPYGPQAFGAFQNQQTSNPLQQIPQLLQVVSSQLQQLQQLEYAQQHQLQQLLQHIPAQLAQLQQLIQFVPQQIQQLQQTAQFQQPFGQTGPTTGLGISTPWGIAPQALGVQSTHVM
jgi:hypothetical protein